MRRRYTLKLKNQDLPLGDKTAVMGILNVTPDSFSDGGQFDQTERAIEHAFALIEDGATLIDIGGESTRPGSKPVSADEEAARILPVIAALAKKNVLISVDTWKSEVAAKALAAGAHMVNDITALQGDPEMAAVIKEFEAAVCLMHNPVLYRGGGAPGHFPEFGKQNRQTLSELAALPLYDALERYLDLALETARKAAIDATRIILDPGFGFGVSEAENFHLFRALPRMVERPYPWLVALSRKRFVQRLTAAGGSFDETTAMLGQVSAFFGAHMLRVHDVATQVKFARVADMVMKEER